MVQSLSRTLTLNVNVPAMMDSKLVGPPSTMICVAFLLIVCLIANNDIVSEECWEAIYWICSVRQALSVGKA